MNISSVNNSNSRVGSNPQTARNSQAAVVSGGQTARKSDRLELSDEAKNLHPIEARIESGYYDKPEVLRAIALKLSLELPIEAKE